MLIPAEVFSIVKMAAKKSTRYAINGVYVRRDGKTCIAAATDGRAIIELRWEDELARSQFPAIDSVSSAPVDGYAVVVPAPVWIAAGKRFAGKQPSPDLRYVLLDENKPDGVVTVATHNGECCTIATMDAGGKFPDYEGLIPSYEIGKDAFDIGCGVDLFMLGLKTLGDSTECAAVGSGARITVPKDGKRPVVIRAKGGNVEGLIAIMPLKLDADTDDMANVMK